MAGHNSREESLKTEKEEVCLERQVNRFEELSEESDELTNFSSEEGKDENKSTRG